MPNLQNTTVHEVARSGPGLVFLTYPELVLSLPVSFFWAIIFFFMLITLGLDRFTSFDLTLFFVLMAAW